MPSSSPSSKRARLSGTDASKNPLHNLYQVIYNLNVGKSEISRYVYHSFLNDNGDWLKIRMYALVDSDFEEGSRKRETVARWKCYVRLSDVITKLHSKIPTVPVVKTSPPNAPPKHSSDDIEALRKENEKLQHDLRETRKELAAAKGGYDIVDPKIVNQVPKGTSKLQPSVKQAKKAERGFADDDEW
ncbi:hypothetical protein QFC20_001800 [Naganishia adeliensis]|uniref:Uncharacterized protein n=1 Tax=Naganishia adeliensis TaxID=92952 RepID=A0ACC2WRI2_9TREE|nr:hypothetical protein QFC20_001800 [Naganishia adeliensis]